MPRRRRNQSTTSDEPQSQRSRHQSPTNDSESLRNMLTEEEYQMSLQAENAFLERQRQIEADQEMARQLQNESFSSPLVLNAPIPPPITFTVPLNPPTNVPTNNVILPTNISAPLTSSNSAQTISISSEFRPVNISTTSAILTPSTSINVNMGPSTSANANPAPSTLSNPSTSTSVNMVPTNAFQSVLNLMQEPLSYLTTAPSSSNTNQEEEQQIETPKPVAPKRRRAPPKNAIPYDGSFCSICFEDLPTDPVACMSCKKCIGCRGCMNDWIKATSGGKTCPLCRFHWTTVKPKVVTMYIDENTDPSTSNQKTPTRQKRQYTRKPKNEQTT